MTDEFTETSRLLTRVISSTRILATSKMLTTIASMLNMKKTATTQSNIVAKPISRFWELVSNERSRLASRTWAAQKNEITIVTVYFFELVTLVTLSILYFCAIAGYSCHLWDELDSRWISELSLESSTSVYSNYVHSKLSYY